MSTIGSSFIVVEFPNGSHAAGAVLALYAFGIPFRRRHPKALRSLGDLLDRLGTRTPLGELERSRRGVDGWREPLHTS
jgi:hypothetical protein